MALTSPLSAGHRVVVPGGTGAVGEGIVRRYLAAGSDVVVPTRSAQRADEFRAVLGDAADEHLHLVVHDYSTFSGARALVEQTVHFLGGVDSVVAPIGGWWAGKALDEIDDDDWQRAFVGLATAHMAVLRAVLPVMSADGAYTVVVGDSAVWPVPGSGLVSMEQAAVLMMQRVVAAERGPSRRVFALQLGPVATRVSTAGSITADQVGEVAVAASGATGEGRVIVLHDDATVAQALADLNSH